MYIFISFCLKRVNDFVEKQTIPAREAINAIVLFLCMCKSKFWVTRICTARS